MGLSDLFDSQGFQDNLLPHLEKLATVPYIDASLFKSRDEYQFALDSANLKAGAYAELLKFLQDQRFTVERLTKQMEAINKKQQYESGK